MYLESLIHKTLVQEQDNLTSIIRKAGTRVDYVPFISDDGEEKEGEEEEFIKDMTETDNRVIHKYIRAYHEAFCVLCDYCFMHNLLNRTFLDSTMHCYHISVENLRRLCMKMLCIT